MPTDAPPSPHAPASAPPAPVAPVGRAPWRAWVPRLAVEGALIIFSVLLALALNTWREGRAQRAEAETARAAILEELQANEQAVAASLAYHTALIDSLLAHARTGRTPSMRLFDRGFVWSAQLSETAWTSASETGVLAHMDYETVLALSRVYADQAAYASQARSVGDVIYGELYRGGTEGIAANYRNLLSIVYTFQYRERGLVDHYARVLPGAGVEAGAEGTRADEIVPGGAEPGGGREVPAAESPS